MPRSLRCVLAGAAHHVTQRGVNRGQVFYSHADRDVYLKLVKDNLEDTEVRVLAYCLMSNHVHWVVRPNREDSLSVLFRRVHGRYAQYLNARLGRTGHLWQNRYYSCIVDERKEDLVLRYAEGNPVRAGLSDSPEDYLWSSAKDHYTGPGAERIALIDWEYWEKRGGAAAWKEYVGQVQDVREAVQVRRCTYSGSPLGSTEFIAQMEAEFERQWRREGRPKRKGMQLETGSDRSASVAAG